MPEPLTSALDFKKVIQGTSTFEMLNDAAREHFMRSSTRVENKPAIQINGASYSTIQQYQTRPNEK
jgi:hypothetical protein